MNFYRYCVNIYGACATLSGSAQALKTINDALHQPTAEQRRLQGSGAGLPQSERREEVREHADGRVTGASRRCARPHPLSTIAGGGRRIGGMGCLDGLNPLDPGGWDREEYPGVRGGDGIGKSIPDCAVGMGSGRVSIQGWGREEYPGLRGGDGVGKSVLNCAVGRDRSLPCPNAAGASSCGDGVLAGAEVEGCLGDVNPLDPLDPGIQGWGREEYPGLRGGDGVGRKSVDPGMGSGRMSIQGWGREECRSRDGIGKSVDPGMGSGRVSRMARWGWDREECRSRDGIGKSILDSSPTGSSPTGVLCQCQILSILRFFPSFHS
jgi:hypothetical protein